MYALRLSIVWIFVVLGSVKCSVSSILGYDRATIVVDRNNTTPCNAWRECVDCTKSRLCMKVNNTLQQVAIINCSADESLPYCDKDTGYCTSVASNDCPSNDFICPFVDGTYPDPKNCTRYHLCVNGHRTTNICPPNNVYDARLQNCKFSRYYYDCITVNCRGKDGQLFTYPTDDRIYGSCVDGRPYLVGRCENYEKFDVNLGRCIRVCRRIENQPTDDCQKYIRCAEVSKGRYQPILQYCACNEGFNKNEGICTKTATCLEGKDLCKTQSLLADLLGLADRDNDSVEEVKNEQDPNTQLSEFIINNSDNNNSNNNINNGNDNANGNIVNGNSNQNNSNSGDVSNVRKPGLRQFIINNSENNQGSNKVSNGNDEANGNIINGNGNDNNKNEGDVGNIKPHRPGLRPLIINNSENSHSDNDVSNGNDSENGNIVNGNGNANNKNEGDVGNVKPQRPGLRPLIINNSENSHSDNDVSNGNDSENGNIVNGNGNGNNSNSGEVGNKLDLRPLIINNSGNSHSDNDVSNGNDSENGNIVNGNGNSNNENQGNVSNYN